MQEVWPLALRDFEETIRLDAASCDGYCGRGYALAHCTEVANYGDANGLASFRETLAETHPDRLFIYESTAKGFNHWKDMWEECARDTFTKRGIFIGWWAKDINRIKRKDRRFPSYGLDEPDEREREQQREQKPVPPCFGCRRQHRHRARARRCTRACPRLATQPVLAGPCASPRGCHNRISAIKT